MSNIHDCSPEWFLDLKPFYARSGWWLSRDNENERMYNLMA